jgi:hypothetical protein
MLQMMVRGVKMCTRLISRSKYWAKERRTEGINKKRISTKQEESEEERKRKKERVRKKQRILKINNFPKICKYIFFL